ncbi:MAG: NAD+ synthase [Deltaproteobacteria bacterium]|jgi:NAD+ synthase/NAD+ synthase (glutamine-hydrolysing)|nr:NAD+ synthase [Deltaproteobacteria bacterium]
MRCSLIQINPKVGDIRGNTATILGALKEAANQGAKLALLPEMSITGYPPRDLLLYPGFIKEVEDAVLWLAREANFPELTIVLGAVGRNPQKGTPLYNLALVIENGEIRGHYAKRLLPTYDVFDEARYFEAGKAPLTFQKDNLTFAVTICEDIWNDEAFWPHPLYQLDPLSSHPPFDVLINLSASPFSVGKQTLREAMLKNLAQKYRALVLYVNQVGANDELIFDGRSSVFAPDGRLLGRAKPWVADILTVDLAQGEAKIAPDDFSPEAETWWALGLGVKDYCAKNGIKSVVLGLSGGIDSALTAAIAASAMGPENVHGLIMPSPYSSSHSLADALDLGKNLSLGSLTILPIEPVMGAFFEVLKPLFQNLPQDATEENIQARIRGTLLMADANKFGRMLLTTGNKSEISVGYCTIYGDMCGALAVIGDLYKTEVFRLAKWVNREKIQIPYNTILKPPSAELKPGQVDADSLPPYEILDKILVLLLEKRQNPEEVALSGEFPLETVKRVANLVKNGEFKRRQAAPVLKITGQAFGVGWRMPIACRSVFTLEKS